MNCLSEQEITPPLTVRRVQGFKKRWPAVLADADCARQVGRANSASALCACPSHHATAMLRQAPPRGARKVLNEAGACVARERAAIPTPIIDLIAIFAFSLRQEGSRCF
jgi:hypothetical protein